MTRMTGPDCVVMCNSINTHTHTHTQHNSVLEPQTLLLYIRGTDYSSEPAKRSKFVGGVNRGDMAWSPHAGRQQTVIYRQKLRNYKKYSSAVYCRATLYMFVCSM